MTAPVLSPNTQANAEGIVNYASGHVTTDAGTPADQDFQLGFAPRYIKWVNATDRIIDEWYDGMDKDGTMGIHVAANGDTTFPSSGCILVGKNAGTSSENPSVFTVPAALIPASKDFYWMALG